MDAGLAALLGAALGSLTGFGAAVVTGPVVTGRAQAWTQLVVGVNTAVTPTPVF